MAAFALLQQRLLRAAGTRLTFGSLLAIAYTSSAVSLAVPVAARPGRAYTQRHFRALGADTATVSLALLISGVVSTVAFAVIVAAGSVASGNPAAAVLGLLTSVCCAVAAALIVIVLHSPRGRSRLRPRAAAAIRLSQRLVHRPAGDPATIASAYLQRLGSSDLGLPDRRHLRVRARQLGRRRAVPGRLIAAIGVAVPWDKLLLVWSAGAAAGSFSPTPYGLGIVDIALITALTRRARTTRRRGRGLALPHHHFQDPGHVRVDRLPLPPGPHPAGSHMSGLPPGPFTWPPASGRLGSEQAQSTGRWSRGRSFTGNS